MRCGGQDHCNCHPASHTALPRNGERLSRTLRTRYRQLLATQQRVSDARTAINKRYSEHVSKKERQRRKAMWNNEAANDSPGSRSSPTSRSRSSRGGFGGAVNGLLRTNTAESNDMLRSTSTVSPPPSRGSPGSRRRQRRRSPNRGRGASPTRPTTVLGVTKGNTALWMLNRAHKLAASKIEERSAQPESPNPPEGMGAASPGSPELAPSGDELEDLSPTKRAVLKHGASFLRHHEERRWAIEHLAEEPPQMHGDGPGNAGVVRGAAGVAAVLASGVGAASTAASAASAGAARPRPRPRPRPRTAEGLGATARSHSHRPLTAGQLSATRAQQHSSNPEAMYAALFVCVCPILLAVGGSHTLLLCHSLVPDYSFGESSNKYLTPRTAGSRRGSSRPMSASSSTASFRAHRRSVTSVGSSAGASRPQSAARSHTGELFVDTRYHQQHQRAMAEGAARLASVRSASSLRTSGHQQRSPAPTRRGRTPKASSMTNRRTMSRGASSMPSLTPPSSGAARGGGARRSAAPAWGGGLSDTVSVISIDTTALAGEDSDLWNLGPVPEDADDAPLSVRGGSGGGGGMHSEGGVQGRKPLSRTRSRPGFKAPHTSSFRDQMHRYCLAPAQA